MTKEHLYASISEKYEELKQALQGTDLERIKKLTLEIDGVTTDFRSVWLLVFWGRLTRGGMILTPMTNHHMMHLPACLNNLPILE